MDNQHVKVIDCQDQVLFSCSIEEQDKAFDYAVKMEELGIEVIIKGPKLVETLYLALQKNNNLKAIQDEISEEIESHNVDSCCFK